MASRTCMYVATNIHVRKSVICRPCAIQFGDMHIQYSTCTVYMYVVTTSLVHYIYMCICLSYLLYIIIRHVWIYCCNNHSYICIPTIIPVGCIQLYLWPIRVFSRKKWCYRHAICTCMMCVHGCSIYIV